MPRLIEDDLTKLLEMFDPFEICLALFDQGEKNRLPSARTGSHIKRDMDLIKKVVPRAYLNQWDRQDLVVQFALTFALRHQVSRLAVALHHLACPHDVSLAKNEDDLTYLLWCYQAEGLFYDRVPSLGVNAIGIVIEFPLVGQCRVVDGYHSHICKNKVNPDQTLCDGHSLEHWWIGNQCQISSSKLLGFYYDWNHIYTYNADQLFTMVSQFWQKYQRQLPSMEVGTKSDQLPQALAMFQISSFQKLLDLDFQTLKRRYLKLSLQLHPDQGGSAEAFYQLKENYQLLCSRLARLS